MPAVYSAEDGEEECAGASVSSVWMFGAFVAIGRGLILGLVELLEGMRALALTRCFLLGLILWEACGL